MNQEMNFSHTHSSNGTAEGVHANVQYVNADESHWLLAVSVFSFGTKDQDLKYLSLHSTISGIYCYACHTSCLCCYREPHPPRIYGSCLINQPS